MRATCSSAPDADSRSSSTSSARSRCRRPIENAGGQPVMWKTGHSLIKDKMRETGRADRRRDVRPHVLQRRLLRTRRRDVRRRAAAAHPRRFRPHGRRNCCPTFPISSRRPSSASTSPKSSSSISSSEPCDISASRYDVIDVDGVRVLFGDGWGLIRASNTQPVIVARYEAASAERLAAIRGEMEGWLREQGVRV